MSAPDDHTAPPLSWHVLLGLLAIEGGCAHGYPLSKACGAHGWLGSIMRMESGMVYHYLKQMTRAGWVEQRADAEPDDPRRRCYAITPAGERALQQWLQGPQCLPERVRPDLLVKLELVRRLTPDALDRVVQTHLDAHARLLAGLPSGSADDAGLIDRFAAVWLRFEAEAVRAWLRTIRPGPPVGRLDDADAMLCP
jgi:DNA-binding PadR family transcriptional regulator